MRMRRTIAGTGDAGFWLARPGTDTVRESAQRAAHAARSAPVEPAASSQGSASRVPAAASTIASPQVATRVAIGPIDRAARHATMSATAPKNQGRGPLPSSRKSATATTYATVPTENASARTRASHAKRARVRDGSGMVR